MIDQNVNICYYRKQEHLKHNRRYYHDGVYSRRNNTYGWLRLLVNQSKHCRGAKIKATHYANKIFDINILWNDVCVALRKTVNG